MTGTDCDYSPETDAVFEVVVRKAYCEVFKVGVKPRPAVEFHLHQVCEAGAVFILAFKTSRQTFFFNMSFTLVL